MKRDLKKWPDRLPLKGIVTKRMADIFLCRVYSNPLAVFVNKSGRTVQNESKQKHPPQN